MGKRGRWLVLEGDPVGGHVGVVLHVCESGGTAVGAVWVPSSVCVFFYMFVGGFLHVSG